MRFAVRSVGREWWGRPATSRDSIAVAPAGDRTGDARPKKLLEDASIKLSAVASNIAGVSSRAMLAALVAGERDPAVMADLARSKLRRKIPDLTEALTGHFDDHHALIVGQLLTRLAATEQAIADLDAHLEVAMAPWAHEIDLLTTIPGVGRLVAWTFIAETGGDMFIHGSVSVPHLGGRRSVRSHRRAAGLQWLGEHVPWLLESGNQG